MKPADQRSINPSTGEVIQTIAMLTDPQLEGATATAAAHYEVWRRQSYAERAVVVRKAASILAANVDAFARLATLEMGKRISEARGEVKLSARILDYYADHAERFLAPVKLDPEVGEAHMESSPLGVIFCVEPWNFPYYQLARIAGPHLMAGNVVMVKHASCVPACAAAFAKLWIDAGAPAGLYTNLPISHDQSDRLIDDPRVKGVALTGSAEAGRRLAARAGRNLKISSLELGGSDAFIVLEDADLESTVQWAVWGRMDNAGQTCCAAKRFIVVESLADAFLDRFQAALSALRPGDPMNEETTLGPLSTEAALALLLGQVDGAVKHGAKLLMGGKRIDRPGWFMLPTILTHITPDNPAFREEFFGPVALFFRVKDEAEAIRLANDADFGLGGSVFTADIARGRRVASQLEAGMVFVNNLAFSDPALPFGGIKNSGYGRELGDLGIQAFVNRKMVLFAAMAPPP
jgi:succinate-semialdehyde dehydrogenase/glutarate-semialdehyde dehydrogenase